MKAVGAEDDVWNARRAQRLFRLCGIAGKKRDGLGHIGADHRQLDDAADAGTPRRRDQISLPMHLLRLRRRDQRQHVRPGKRGFIALRIVEIERNGA
jgi:hypothetical protein